MCAGSHQFLRPSSLGFHSASNSDSPWLPEIDTPDLPVALTFFQRIQHSLRVTCALASCMICKVPLPTFLDTLGFQQEIWPFTASALMGTLALETVVAAAWKRKVKPTELCVAFQGAPGPFGEAAWDAKQRYELVCWAKQKTRSQEPGFWLWLLYLPAGCFRIRDLTSLSLESLL